MASAVPRPGVLLFAVKLTGEEEVGEGSRCFMKQKSKNSYWRDFGLRARRLEVPRVSPVDQKAGRTRFPGDPSCVLGSSLCAASYLIYPKNPSQQFKQKRGNTGSCA